MKSSGDRELSWNIPHFMLIGPVSRAPCFWTIVILVFTLVMLDLMKLVIIGCTLYRVIHLIIHECGTLSNAFL